MNGRTVFRNALQGRNRERPPFVPFVHGLAARTANVPLREMVRDADCYSNALEGLYRLLGNEVMLNNFDVTVERESLGCEVAWSGAYDAPVAAPGDGLPEIGFEEFLGSGRIPVLLEVTGRLALSPGRDAGVACAVTGPCALVTGMLAGGADGKGAAEVVKHLGGYLTKLVRALCELKVDALFFREDPLGDLLPQALREQEGAYRALYGTLFNIVKAYNAFPVLVTDRLPLDAVEGVHGVARPTGMVLLGNSVGESELLLLKKLGENLRMSFGLPLQAGTTGTRVPSSQLARVQAFVAEHGAPNLFFTSNGEIPHDIEMESLHAMMSGMRGEREEGPEA